jgi:hypothetical protein
MLLIAGSCPRSSKQPPNGLFTCNSMCSSWNQRCVWRMLPRPSNWLKTIAMACCTRRFGSFGVALVGVQDIARGQDTAEFTARGLGLASLLHAQLQRPELQHAKGPLDAEQQLIVEPVQVVDVVGIADERVEHAAQLHQMAPVFVGA